MDLLVTPDMLFPFYYTGLSMDYVSSQNREKLLSN